MGPMDLPLGEANDIEQVRRERDAASARARALEHELGELRARTKQMEAAAWRRTARREYWRSVAERGRRFARRVARALKRRVVRSP